MININNFVSSLKNAGIGFFTGVPDSYLNGFCNRLLEEKQQKHIIAANEGGAIAVATGHYLATGEISLVYMQNSGMGNAVNPLVSLADRLVYGIPLVLLIGWRGEPGTNDWVQHERQGNITLPLLQLMDIPYVVLSEDSYSDDVNAIVNKCKNEMRAVAIVVSKGILDGDKQNIIDDRFPLSRKEAMNTVLDSMPEKTIYLATTGRTTRELFYLRKERGETDHRDFLNVGAMGHTLSIAVGLAIEKREDRFVVFDGDAAAIMHMGAMTMVSNAYVPNLIHIVLNNGAHESVGGQPSAGDKIDFIGIAEACGYKTVGRPVYTAQELSEACNDLLKCDGAGFIEVKIHKGLKEKLPPLEFSHIDAKNGLMAELKK